MVEWKGFNDQEVIDNLRRGLMMVRDFPLGFSIFVFIKSSNSFFCCMRRGFKALWSWKTDTAPKGRS